MKLCAKRCAKPLKGNPKESTNSVLVNNEIQCTDKESFVTRNKYWIRGKCEERDTIDIHEIVQINNALQHNYIYCASLNITTFDREIACPQEVFALQVINDSKFIRSLNRSIHSKLTIRYKQSPQPSYASKCIFGFFSKLNLSIDSLNTENFIENFDKETDYHKYGNIFLVIVIFVLCIAFIFFIRKFKICNRINIESTAHVSQVPQT
jgi:hypothetical protein